MSVRRREPVAQPAPESRLQAVLRAGKTAGPYNPLLDPDDEMTDISIDIWILGAESKVNETAFYTREDPSNAKWNKALEIIRDWKRNLPRTPRQSVTNWLKAQIRSANMAQDAIEMWYGVRDPPTKSLFDAFENLASFYKEQMPR